MRLLGQGGVCEGHVGQSQSQGRVWTGEHLLCHCFFVFLFLFSKYSCTGELLGSRPHCLCVRWLLSDVRVTWDEFDCTGQRWSGAGAGGSWRPACTRHPRANRQGVDKVKSKEYCSLLLERIWNLAFRGWPMRLLVRIPNSKFPFPGARQKWILDSNNCARIVQQF